MNRFQRRLTDRTFCSKEDLESKRNQSLDDFFQDFNEIISSDMKTTPTPYEQGYQSAATNIIPYSDQSNAFNSSVSGVDFNLDLTQFYINTNESDFLNANEMKSDFSNGMVHFSPTQCTATFPDTVADDNFEYSVLDLSNDHTKMQEPVKYHSSSHGDVVNDQMEFSVIDHTGQTEQMPEYSDSKVSVTTPLNQFYLDFKVNGNGEVNSASNEDNSVVTYISKNSLQSVEYINESGQTETVMYVDQQQDGSHDENIGSSITQYEIINFDDYQYEAGTDGSLHHNNNNNNNVEVVELSVPNSNPVQIYDEENLYGGQQTNILSTLFSDKNNKIIVIAKPLKNPKVRRSSSHELCTKFDEIDNNPTNIAFAKQRKPRVKGGRKQKLETINQIETEVADNETKRSRPKVNKAIATATIAITETPKLPSKFMKERKKKMLARKKRPRKLCWDSDSDYENGEKFNKKLEQLIY